MKRTVAFLISMLMIATVFPLGVFAADKEIPEEPISLDFASREGTFYHYLQEHKDFPLAKEDIVISASAYDKADADVKKLPSKTDENDVTKENIISWTGEEGSVTYKFEVKEDALYEVMLTYLPIKGRGLPISFSIEVDGEIPYESFETLNFERTWIDSKPEGVSDGKGNCYASEQIEKFIFKDSKAVDRTGQYSEPLQIALSKGTHTLTLNSLSGECYLAAVTLKAPTATPSYDDFIKEHASTPKYSGEEVLIDGESAIYKSTASMNPLIDNSDPSITPSEPFKEQINYIGSTAWQTPAEKIIWEFEAPESGLYKMAFRFRQNYIINGNSYRILTIDGEVPFEEATNITFKYDGDWQFMQLNQPGTDEPALIYLEKGKHQLGLEVTLGEMDEIARVISDLTYDIGDLYLKIKMITGENIDSGRSYELFKNIEGFNDTLKANIDVLNTVSDRIVQITGETSNNYTANLQNMARVMQEMLDNPYLAQKYVNDYYTNYCSLAALVTDLAEMPLDIDQMILASPDKAYEKEMAGFWEKTSYSFDRFVASFSSSYKSTIGSDDDKTLTLWVTWGRDQTQILNSLVKDSFETEHPGITVNVQIVGASLIQAILIGDGPDVLLGQIRSEPVNYGMRNALIDLKQFPDYVEVITRFQDGAVDPYTLGNAVYGLPDTQGFSIMYYRTDIFDDLGLEVPKTWDEFRQTTALLQRQNLQAGLSAPTVIGQGTLSQYATFLMQDGSSLYNKNLDSTALLESDAVEKFVYWTDFYTNLGYDTQFDFYNRFRSGTMPLGVASYSQYVLFSQAAPEIAGKWSIAPMPGTMQEDGTIDYTQADSGTACVIPITAGNKELSWEFIKWWTRDDIQYRYSTMVEAVLGEVGRVTTSNVEAFKRLAWESDDLDILLEAWSNVKGLQEIPGGYYVERSVYQAFWNVVNLKENPKDMIVKWGKTANAEITRKRGEYADELAHHFN